MAGSGPATGSSQHKYSNTESRPAPKSVTGGRRGERGALFAIEIDRSGFAAAREVEHVHDRARGGIERAATEPRALQPVVLDKAHHRVSGNLPVADEIGLGERRDHDERHARSRPAAAVDRLALDPGPRRAGAAFAWAVKLVGLVERGARRLGESVIVPAVGIVVGEDDRSILP